MDNVLGRRIELSWLVSSLRFFVAVNTLQISTEIYLRTYFLVHIIFLCDNIQERKIYLKIPIKNIVTATSREFTGISYIS